MFQVFPVRFWNLICLKFDIIKAVNALKVYVYVPSTSGCFWWCVLTAERNSRCWVVCIFFFFYSYFLISSWASGNSWTIVSPLSYHGGFAFSPSFRYPLEAYLGETTLRWLQTNTCFFTQFVTVRVRQLWSLSSHPLKQGGSLRAPCLTSRSDSGAWMTSAGELYRPGVYVSMLYWLIKCQKIHFVLLFAFT